MKSVFRKIVAATLNFLLILFGVIGDISLYSVETTKEAKAASVTQDCSGGNVTIEEGTDFTSGDDVTIGGGGTCTVTLSGNATFGTLEILASATFDASGAAFTTSSFTVRDNATVTHKSEDSVGLQVVSTGAITIETLATISGEAKGCAKRREPNASNTCVTEFTGLDGAGHSTGCAAHGGGGGHGGEGGVPNTDAGAGGARYGSALNPSFYGSGGGDYYSCGGTGGAGGGLVRLTASGAFTNNGTISVNGANGTTGGGGGAGGSIYLDVASYAGAGTVSANGGAGGGSIAGKGGGGRVAIYSNGDSRSALSSALSKISATVNDSDGWVSSNPKNGSVIVAYDPSNNSSPIPADWDYSGSFAAMNDDTIYIKDGFEFSTSDGSGTITLNPGALQISDASYLVSSSSVSTLTLTSESNDDALATEGITGNSLTCNSALTTLTVSTDTVDEYTNNTISCTAATMTLDGNTFSNSALWAIGTASVSKLNLRTTGGGGTVTFSGVATTTDTGSGSLDIRSDDTSDIIAFYGATYTSPSTGAATMSSFFLNSTASLYLAGSSTVAGNLDNSTLTALTIDTGSTWSGNMDLDGLTSTTTISGWLDASGSGCPARFEPEAGNICVAETTGLGGGGRTSSCDTAGGASYGGAGSAGLLNAAGSTYGDSTSPLLFGAGGGSIYSCGPGVGGTGGGLVRLSSMSTVDVDGGIFANSGPHSIGGGGGSGGSVNLSVASLTGDGFINSDGGTAGESNQGAGGGGRIAISYVSTSGAALSNATASGGVNSANASRNGADGTLYTLVLTPDSPTTLYSADSSTASGTTNPTDLTDFSPVFSAQCVFASGQCGDIGIEVDDNSDFASPIWQSGQLSLSAISNGARNADVEYSGSQLAYNTTYYWRARFYNTAGVAGDWSTETATFLVPLDLELYSFALGGSIKQGESVDILWGSAQGATGDTFNIDYSTDSFSASTSIAAGFTATQSTTVNNSYTWTIPNASTVCGADTCSGVQIRVESATDTSSFTASTQSFTIQSTDGTGIKVGRTFSDSDFYTSSSGVVFSSGASFAPAAWYDASWSKRQALTISETSGSTLSAYQVAMTLSNSVFTFSDAQTNGEDLRFVGSDNSTALDYWIETYSSTGESGIVWVEIPSIAASADTTIYMYYDNSAATSAESGSETFLFFDDFDFIDSGQWPTTTGTPSVSNGELILDAGEGLFADNYTIPSNTVFESRANPQSTGRRGGAIRAATTSGNGFVQDPGASVIDILWWETAQLWAESAFGENNWFTGFTADHGLYKIIYEPGGADTAQFYYNRANEFSSSSITDSVKPTMYSHNGQSTYDWFFVRNYASSEPTIAYGAAEDYVSPSDQTITTKTSHSFTSVNTFVASVTETATGAAKFQISDDGGSTWKYCVGSTPTTTVAGYSEANTAAQLTDACLANLSSGGTFSVKTYLHVDSTNSSDSVTIHNYSYTIVTNTSPTLTSPTASENSNNLGWVDFSFTVDDADDDDTVQVKAEYSGDGSTWTAATLITTDANTTATYGDPGVTNGVSYQIGTVSAYVTTSSGANTINAVWDSYADLETNSSSIQLRLTPYDGSAEGTAVTTSAFSLSNSPVTAITVTPATATVGKGSRLSFSGGATYNDGSSGTLDASDISWSADNERGSITSAGLFQGLQSGTVIITGSYTDPITNQTATATATITVSSDVTSGTGSGGSGGGSGSSIQDTSSVGAEAGSTEGTTGILEELPIQTPPTFESTSEVSETILPEPTPEVESTPTPVVISSETTATPIPVAIPTSIPAPAVVVTETPEATPQPTEQADIEISDSITITPPPFLVEVATPAPIVAALTDSEESSLFARFSIHEVARPGSAESLFVARVPQRATTLVGGKEINNARRASDLISRDSDADGVPDAIEEIMGTNPGLSEDAPVDTNNNNVPDIWEQTYQVEVTDPTVDLTGGAMSIGLKAKYGLNPTTNDTDGDGISDIDEVALYNTNPLRKTNLQEVLAERPVQLTIKPKTVVTSRSRSFTGMSVAGATVRLYLQEPDGSRKILAETVADETNKFMAQVEGLTLGNNTIVVQTFIPKKQAADLKELRESIEQRRIEEIASKKQSLLAFSISQEAIVITSQKPITLGDLKKSATLTNEDTYIDIPFESNNDASAETHFIIPLKELRRGFYTFRIKQGLKSTDGSIVTFEEIVVPFSITPPIATIRRSLLGADALSSDLSEEFEVFEADPIEIIVDTKASVASLSPEKLATVPLTDEHLVHGLRVSVENNRPVIEGTLHNAQPNTEVQIVANWQSLLLTSAMIADTNKGDFKIYAPEGLENGNHVVSLRSVQEGDRTTHSKDIQINFAVQASTSHLSTLLIVGAIALVIVVVFVLFITLRKKPEQLS